MIDPSAFVHETALVEDGVSIGPDAKVWNQVHVRHDARIGRGTTIGGGTTIAPEVSIGALVKINSQVYVCRGVTIEDGVMLSAHVVFTNDRAPRATDPGVTGLRSAAFGDEHETTLVRRGASVGANATIGPGVTLGTFCMVGMGSVVTRDVPDFGLVLGNPARLVGFVDRDGRVVFRSSPEQSLPEEGAEFGSTGGLLRFTGGKLVPV